VKREHLNTLILNLYPGNKGFSVGLRMHSKSGGKQNGNVLLHMKVSLNKVRINITDFRSVD
jgi:hypothetical protein